MSRNVVLIPLLVFLALILTSCTIPILPTASITADTGTVTVQVALPQGAPAEHLVVSGLLLDTPLDANGIAAVDLHEGPQLITVKDQNGEIVAAAYIIGVSAGSASSDDINHLSATTLRPHVISATPTDVHSADTTVVIDATTTALFLILGSPLTLFPSPLINTLVTPASTQQAIQDLNSFMSGIASRAAADPQFQQLKAQIEDCQKQLQAMRLCESGLRTSMKIAAAVAQVPSPIEQELETLVFDNPTLDKSSVRIRNPLPVYFSAIPYDYDSLKQLDIPLLGPTAVYTKRKGVEDAIDPKGVFLVFIGPPTFSHPLALNHGDRVAWVADSGLRCLSLTSVPQFLPQKECFDAIVPTGIGLLLNAVSVVLDVAAYAYPLISVAKPIIMAKIKDHIRFGDGLLNWDALSDAEKIDALSVALQDLQDILNALFSEVPGGTLLAIRNLNVETVTDVGKGTVSPAVDLAVDMAKSFTKNAQTTLPQYQLFENIQQAWNGVKLNGQPLLPPLEDFAQFRRYVAQGSQYLQSAADILKLLDVVGKAHLGLGLMMEFLKPPVRFYFQKTDSGTIVDLPPPSAQNDAPSATISSPANNSAFTQGQDITFQGSATDPEDGPLSGSSLHWASNIDGQIGTGTSLTKSDLSIGQHTITLTATDSQGATGTASITITIQAVPNAPFLQVSPMSLSFAGPFSGANPPARQINITNAGGGTLQWTASSDRSWLSISPASGTAPSSPNVSVNMAGLSVGTYSGAITVTATTAGTQNNPQLVNVALKIIHVQDTRPPALITDFSALDGENGQSTLTWTNPSDSDLAEVIVKRKTGRYPLDHADGTDVASCHLTNASSRARVSCTDTGLANVILYFYTVFGQDQTGNWNDQVFPGRNADTARPLGIPPPRNRPPVARFSASPSSGIAPLMVFFDARSSTDPDPGDSITSHKWDFGDTTTGSGITINHTYSNPGDFTAQLTISDSHGAKAMATKQISVAPVRTPILEVDRLALSFASQIGSPNPPAQPINITNSGVGTLEWTASSDQSWLSITPTSGTAPSTANVSVDISGLSNGTYYGAITVSATTAGTSNTPRIVNVSLTVGPAAEIYSFVRQWGSAGMGLGQFSLDLGPRGLAVVGSSPTYVYEADYDNMRIQVFDEFGNFIKAAPLERFPQDIKFDGAGAFYVRTASKMNNSDLVGPSLVKLDMNLNEVWRRPAPADGFVSFGLCIDSDGNIHVPVAQTTDRNDDRMWKYDSAGNFLGEYGAGLVKASGQCTATNGFVYAIGTTGTNLRKFSNDGTLVDTKEFGLGLEALALDNNGNFFIGVNIGDVSPCDCHIRKYSPSFQLLADWGGAGSGSGTFFRVTDIAVDSQGTVYVSDGADGGSGGQPGNWKIQVFQKQVP